MKALSIKQPWAWLICAGYKDIENRDWKLPAYGFFPPQRIYVHASKVADWEAIMNNYLRKKMVDKIIKGRQLSLGAIIGEVDIIDCVTQSKSPWFVGEYGFVLINPILYGEPIPYKGRLGFFEVSL